METGNKFAQTQDLVAHERTYKAFSLLTRWAMLVIGDAVLALTLWFATPAGLWGALFVGFAVFVAGYLLLIRREEHQPLDLWVEGR